MPSALSGMPMKCGSLLPGGIIFCIPYIICFCFQWFLFTTDVGIMVADFQSCGIGIERAGTLQDVGNNLG